ncbi:aminodeoxychorismate synthase component I [Marichromatium gracile]|uniref:aminodeoxychorismate synthase n=1 Tax=Marichromatium gracile TaxID=1048 RepID=A0A4R4ALL6_MARGR|nr:aminodeoxychorismate synthase component I [Marichromatium gracile]MBK1708763.1 aminodeoxychorismate synthase, component I [Marichromatium gracile]TCW40054.1 para-aminobenzoate synthetase component 1 [Marichromatium gracile]
MPDRHPAGPLTRELPYVEDCAARFAPLLRRRWPVWLDSGRPFTDQGRYDILSADPRLVLVTRGCETTLIEADGARRRSGADPFGLLAEALGPSRPCPDGLPFAGGAIGFFGYDLGRRLHRLPERVREPGAPPDLAVGLYDWGLVVDHHERRARLFAPTEDELERRARLLEAAAPRLPPYRTHGAVRPDWSHATYVEAIARIHAYLHAGDCYQVNLAQRFSVSASGHPWHAYRLLRELNAAPFSAYLQGPDWQVLSSSPERFLEVRDGRVETKPIKGTRPRDPDPARDRALAETLRLSPKDRAENLMIVDLLRNDLGRVCDYGSVRVPALFAIEHYARVHHLVSTVSGRLAPGRSAVELLRAAFPGGSITGAPKRRAMAVIDELEPAPRGPYCGAIGYLGHDGAMDTNIAIRTLVHAAGQTRLWAGGGIVVDSEAEAEYRETFDKAAPLLELLERLRDRRA